jgi:uncharacterized membrane protein
MLVVVFDTAGKAYEGKQALLELDNEGSLTAYGCAVIARNSDGTAGVEQIDDSGPLGTLAGTALGMLVGLLAGPVGVAVGAATGMAAGSAVDLRSLRIGDDFIDDVASALTPGKFALVAEVEEEWATPVDVRMEAIGGVVFRRAISDVERTADDEDVTAMKADVAQMKAELAQSNADRKAKMQEKINQLDSKIKAQLDKARERRQQAENQAKRKADILRAKASALKAKAIGTPA